MKMLLAAIILLIVHLQYRLWLSDDSFEHIKVLEMRLDEVKKQVEEKKQRNDALYAEIEDLRDGQEALEERARNELGMIKENETFFQVLE